MKRSKTVQVLFLVIFALLLSVNFAKNATAAFPIFYRSLKQGSSGDDVKELQKILNRDAATSIQGGGPGSVGQETIYFGPKTKEAVVRFQEKYRNKILLPVGLTSGTGFVGASTNKVLNELFDLQTIKPANVSTEQDVLTTGTTSGVADRITKSDTPVSDNPNTKNLNNFLSNLRVFAKEKGMADAAIAHMEQRITMDVSTTTDLMKKFIEDVNKSKTGPSSQLGKAYAKLIAKIEDFFSIKNATAGVGVPFGGVITFVYPCSCSYTWYLEVTLPAPVPRTYFLTYIPGTQAFLSYNIPYTTWILGDYEPGAGLCISEPEADCALNVPSQGMITPLVGTSPY